MDLPEGPAFFFFLTLKCKIYSQKKRQWIDAEQKEKLSIWRCRRKGKIKTSEIAKVVTFLFAEHSNIVSSQWTPQRSGKKCVRKFKEESENMNDKARCVGKISPQTDLVFTKGFP